MGKSNLPPGCTSDDGGIDYALELALETLCDKVQDAETAVWLNKQLDAMKDKERIEQLESLLTGAPTDAMIAAGIRHLQRNVWGPTVSFDDMRRLLKAALAASTEAIGSCES
jgi:hypothetical protein